MVGIGMGPTEIVIILAILALIFGAKRLPELGSGLGKAIKNFKSGVTGADEIDVTPEKEEIPENNEEPSSSSPPPNS